MNFVSNFGTFLIMLDVHSSRESWGFKLPAPHAYSSRDRRQLWHLGPILPQVYRSLEYELQKHVSRQDTLQQCQAWISAVQPDLKPSPQPPLSRAEAVKQVVESGKFIFLMSHSFITLPDSRSSKGSGKPDLIVCVLTQAGDLWNRQNIVRYQSSTLRPDQ